MNCLIQAPPAAVLIGGKAVPINTDFRVCLKAIRALDDERLTEAEKLTVLCTLLYPAPPTDTALAISQGLKFLNCGKEAAAAKLAKQVWDLRVTELFPQCIPQESSWPSMRACKLWSL